MSETKVMDTGFYTIKVVPANEQRSVISDNDAEMDIRAVGAVRAALTKAKICKKPIAGYDIKTKKAYIEYADGARKYVE